MKILVLGGMHGNEKLGITLVQSLRSMPIDGVDAMIANPKAVRQNTRYIETDLNRSFGAGKDSYERRRARLLTNIAKRYDIVLDFHNTMTPGNNCSFAGPTPDERLLMASSQLGLSRCISATYDCINKWCPNTLSVEISQSDELDDVDIWRKKIEKLQNGGYKGVKRAELYKFVGRCTWAQKRQMPDREWVPFQRLTTNETKILGYIGAVYPIFVGSRLTEYYATIVKKMENEI